MSAKLDFDDVALCNCLRRGDGVRSEVNMELSSDKRMWYQPTTLLQWAEMRHNIVDADARREGDA